MRHLEVDRLKEDLLDLYDKWDVLNALILDKLVLVEESLNKFKSVEEDLGEVSDSLKTEVNHLYLKMTRNNRDSGISDGSELRLDKGIEKQTENIENIKKTIMGLKKNFPGTSLQIKPFLSALKESSNQLGDLKSFVLIQSSRKPSAQMIAINNVISSGDLRFVKLWKMITSILLFLLILAVSLTPDCCENSNSLYLLLPSITFTSCLRPI